MLRTTFLALSVVLALANAASAQFPRSSGPANPRYYPDLYKGPAWGMTLSEYYTFGNKADGPYGYAIGGYRYGANQDIQRWKQATGTALPPGYYWQRWRERRDERLGAASGPDANPAARGVASRNSEGSRLGVKQQAKSAASSQPDLDDLEDSEVEPNEPDEQPAAAPAPLSSRRNALTRGLTQENSAKSLELAGPEQSDAANHAMNKFRRIRSTDPTTGDDKN